MDTAYELETSKKQRDKEVTSNNFFDIIYNSNLGDYNEFVKQFNFFIDNNSSIKNNVLLQLYNNMYCAEDLEEILNANVQTIRKTLKRLFEESLISIEKTEEKTKYYSLNENGISCLKNYFNKEFVSKNNYILNNIRISRKESVENIEMKELINNVFDFLETKPDYQDFLKNGFFTFDLIEILELELQLGEFIIENFFEAKALFIIALKDRIPEISKIKFHIENIKFLGLEKIKTQNYKISSIPKRDNSFISINGLLVKKDNKIKEQIIRVDYLCTNPSCPYSENKLKVPQTNGKNKLKSCPKCKSPVDVIDTKIKLVQYLEVKDIEDDSSIKIKAYDNLIQELSKVKVGEELTLNGHIESIENDNYKNDSPTFDRVFILNNFKSSSGSINLDEEDIEEIQKELKNIENRNPNLYDFLVEPIKKMYPLHPDELIKFCLIPQFLNFNKNVENIYHVLAIGSPNTYKTSFFETIGEISPKTKSIDFSMLSVDKFYGGVKADGLTDVGLAMSLRDGSLIIDEIDKDKDSYSKSASMLNELLSKQTATKERVGASIFLKDVNMRVYGVMNNNKDYEDLKFILKNINESTVTRFFIINFDYFVNEEIKENISEQMLLNNSNPLLDFDLSIRKKIITYQRNLQIDISEIHQPLLQFNKDIRKITNSKEHLTRNIQQIKNIIVGLCRMKNKLKATIEDFEEAKHLIQWTFKTQDSTLDEHIKKIDKLSLENSFNNDFGDCKNKVLEYFKNKEELNLNDLMLEFKGFEKDLLLKVINKLKKDGLIFEPKKDLVRLLN